MLIAVRLAVLKQMQREKVPVSSARLRWLATSTNRPRDVILSALTEHPPKDVHKYLDALCVTFHSSALVDGCWLIARASTMARQPRLLPLQRIASWPGPG